ncbi:sulfotransferase [Nonomuraea helvata]|uniref:Sulfotransferase n=1 Tax=Nonomuraea helvata TaxID=37484 RepID=A0ABV5S101_9ACTN
MKVIGAGFGRTGTRSLQTALEILGYGPCYHMSTVIAEPYRVRQWLDIGEGRSYDWDTLFAGFRSAVDWPVPDVPFPQVNERGHSARNGRGGCCG